MPPVRQIIDSPFLRLGAGPPWIPNWRQQRSAPLGPPTPSVLGAGCSLIGRPRPIP